MFYSNFLEFQTLKGFTIIIHFKNTLTTLFEVPALRSLLTSKHNMDKNYNKPQLLRCGLFMLYLKKNATKSGDFAERALKCDVRSYEISYSNKNSAFQLGNLL